MQAVREWSVQVRLGRWWANRELVLTTVGQGIQVVAGFLFVKLVSLAVTDVEFGRYSLAMSVANLVALMPFAAIDQGMARFIAAYQREGRFSQRFTEVFLFYGFLLGLYAAAGLAIWVVGEEAGTGFGIPCLPVLIPFVVANTLSLAFLNVVNFRRRRGLVTLVRGGESLGKILLLGLLMGRGGVVAETLVGLSTIVLLGNLGILTWRNRGDFAFREVSWPDTVRTVRELVGFSLPVFLWAGASWIHSMSALWLLQHFWGTRAVGHFAMLSNLASIFPLQAGAILSTYLAPILYELDAGSPAMSGDGLLKKHLVWLTGLVIVGALAVFPLGTLVIKIFSSDQYLEFGWMLPVLFALAGAKSVAQLSTLEVFLRKETGFLLAPNVVAALVSLGLGLILIPTLKMVGALIAMAGSTAVLVVLTLRVTLRKRI